MQRTDRMDRSPLARLVDGRLLLFVVFAVVLAACGGAGVDGGGASASAANGGGSGAAGASDGTGPGSADVDDFKDGPVTTTIAGVTFGHTYGTCDVSADQVRVHVARLDFPGLATVDVRWQSDDARARFGVVNTGGLDPQPPTPYELVASSTDADTTWDVDVDGTNATIQLRMHDVLPSGSGDFLDVTIGVRCDVRAFGGADPEPTDGPVRSLPEPTDPGSSAITLILGGTTYTWTHPGCATDDVVGGGFVALNPDLHRLFVSPNGDATLNLPDGTAWTAQGVQLVGSGTSASWSGTMTSSGGSAPATLTIDC